jgi:hypothetical protein
MATWTSGEPVSPLAVAYCAINSCLRSAVIDIVLFLSRMEETGRLEPGCRPAKASAKHARFRDVAAHIGYLGRKR